MLTGFDASGWSGSINYVAAKNAGMRYAYFRVGRGIPDGATNDIGIDHRWVLNKVGSMQAGLPVGGYWRFFPSVNLDLQARKFATNLNQINGMLDPWVDIEDTGGLNPKQLTDWAIEVLIRVEQLTGRKPILYTGKNFYDNNLEYWRLDRWQLAIAWQTTGTWREYGAIFWQYLLDTPVSWAQGRIDLQKFALDDLSKFTHKHELLYWFDSSGMLHGPMVWSDKLLPEAGQQGTQSNNLAIVHTMVGYLNGTDSYFRRFDIGLESTFGIGGKYDGIQLDGAIYQWMRIFDRADANGAANYYGASWETSDGGGERYREWWSAKQAESIAQSLAAWCYYFGRPPELIDRALSNRKGLAFHRQGISPYKNPGDDSWSPDSGKVCPGFERSDQLVRVVIPRVKQILASLNYIPSIPSPQPPVKVPDMDLNDVVGIDKYGNTFTVRESLIRVMNLDLDTSDSTLIKELQSSISRDIAVSSGQPTWSELGGLTWSQLEGQKWGKINIDSNSS